MATRPESGPSRGPTTWLLLTILFLVLAIPNGSYSAPVSRQDAEKMALRWAKTQRPQWGLGSPGRVDRFETIDTLRGDADAFVLYLDTGGFVVVPSDDQVEPVIAFVPSGTLERNDQNPLWVLLKNDIPQRMSHARASRITPPSKQGARGKDASRRWNHYLSEDSSSGEDNLYYGLTVLDEVWVPPLIATRWNQSKAGSELCYNYFTPNNYPAGCVATAMAQILRYWQYPTSGIGVLSRTIKVNGVDQQRSTRGGDGVGGAYQWAQMPNQPTGATPDSQRQQIGALLHDCGVLVKMQYTSSGSGASLYESSIQLKNPLGYAQAVYAYNAELTLNGRLNEMANPNLDLGQPVLLGIRNSSGGGHAVIVDGYGYQNGTLYHHLNMGWGGAEDAWYNLPTVDDRYYGFTIVDTAVYNISPTHASEIVSGRVTDYSGTPQSGVQITAQSSSQTWQGTTNANGIYALRIPSNTTITVSSEGYGSMQVSTGQSQLWNQPSGNRWATNFPTSPGITSPSGDSELQAISQRFEWSPFGTVVDAWMLTLGSAEAVDDLHNSGTLQPETRSVLVDNLPDNRSILHARLSWRIGETWHHRDHTFLSAASGPVAPPLFSPDSSIQQGTFEVSMTSATIGAQIHFTTNGTEPSESSTLFQGNLLMTPPVQLRAKAFRSGQSASTTTSAFFRSVPPPQIAPIGNKSIQAGQTIQFTISTSGEDDGSFTYHATGESIP